MPRKNPLSGPIHKLKDTALGALRDPKGTADVVREQAKGVASLGRMVAGTVAEEVARRRRRGTDAPRAAVPPPHPVPARETAEPPTKKQGDPVAPSVPPAPAKKATPADVAKKTAKKAPAKKGTTKAAKKTATKAPVKKAAGAPGDKLPPRKKSTAKTARKRPDSSPPHEPNPEAQ